MHVGMCVLFSLPCPSAQIFKTLKRKKRSQRARDRAAPPLQGSRASWDALSSGKRAEGEDASGPGRSRWGR